MANIVRVALLAALAVAVWFVPGASAGAVEPAARATITFDVGSGKVLASSNARAPERVASTCKLLTALVVRANVPMSTDVPITARAEAVPPLKLTMKPGTRWHANDLLHAMLIASLNDAATALAIQAGGGSIAGFDRAARVEARRLGLKDHPRLLDPAGLDGPSSVDGGNLISARDLAIVTRAFLADPVLAGIVRLPSYHFQGGDGRPHVVYNHDAFLSTYPGAVGVKTGYTEKSGHSLVAAATRNGRTIATVVIGSADPVGIATRAIDLGFATPADGVGGPKQDILPAHGFGPVALGDAAPSHRPETFTAQVAPITSSGFGSELLVGLVVALVVVVTSIVLRGRRRRRSEPSRAA